ncbi:hypothetical protein [Neolewinella agarilytica]|uniref:hypothetical protein n=1 Tax=Neolewinella agarilytica TaxID=478744 RepID=UPI002352D8E5|nr:hypothetical protein [Neolewinella agarilytica]
MLTQILAAGAMGVSIFFIFKVYDLLKNEQGNENPRPVFLRSIYVFMGFAVLMTLLSLGIEFARHSMNLDTEGQGGFTKELQELTNKSYYALDRNGNPEPIELEIGGQKYTLAKAFPDAFFKETHLKLKPAGNQKLLAVKNNNGQEITFGYFDKSDIDDFATTPAITPPGPSSPSDPILDREKLMATGLMYTPPSKVRQQIQTTISQKKADESIANKYLVEFVNGQNLDRKLQELAVKILIQPEQMNQMDTLQYGKLIAALSSDGPRKQPWRHFELAQVYLSRSIQQNSAADRQKYFESLCRYRKNYLAQAYLVNDPEKYSVEKTWYENAEKELQTMSCDDNCNCG